MEFSKVEAKAFPKVIYAEHDSESLTFDTDDATVTSVSEGWIPNTYLGIDDLCRPVVAKYVLESIGVVKQAKPRYVIVEKHLEVA